MKYFFYYLVTLVFIVVPCVLHANELLQDKVTTVKAEVVEIEKEETKNVPGTDVSQVYQSIKAIFLEGDRKGEVVTIDNDYLALKKGEKFYALITLSAETGKTYYAVLEPYRLSWVLFFVGLFLLLTIIFGGIQGVRGLLALAGSFVLIIYFLVPGILAGYSPILVSLGVSALIIIVGSYITHGFNLTTTSAVVGMIVTVTFTGLLAFFAVSMTRLSGFSNEEAIYLNLGTRGSIDLVGLLLGGILIGLLGVLYDVAIGQAISVEELSRIAPHASRRHVYKRVVRMGREHIGALVNTLAIAYVGVSLPLILLYIQSEQTELGLTLNRELFATEIVRTMVGSIGLVIAVPITTLIAVAILMPKREENLSPAVQEEESKKLETFHHHH